VVEAILGFYIGEKNNQIVEHSRNIQAKLHLIHFPTESYDNSAPWQQPFWISDPK